MLKTALDNTARIIKGAAPDFVEVYPDDVSVNGYYPILDVVFPYGDDVLRDSSATVISVCVLLEMVKCTEDVDKKALYV